MPLSCYCDSDDCSWYYRAPDDYEKFLETKRRKRCSSCNDLIAHGEMVARFNCNRPAKDDVELRIYGDDPEAIPMADKWLCERCADLYFSFVELGFDCVAPDENMLELAKDYANSRQTGEGR